jgi:hypothetical protein
VGRHVRYPANSISHCPESSTDFHAEGPQPGTKPKGTTGKERQGRQGTTRTPHLGDREVRGRQGDCPEANFDYTYGVLILLLQSDSECVRPFLALSGQFFFFLFFSSWGSRTREPPNLLYRPINTPPHLTITTKQTTDGRAQVCLTFLSSLSSLSSLPHYSPTTTLPIALGKYLPTGSQPRRPPSSSTCDVPWMPCPLDPLFFSRPQQRRP